MNQEAIEQAVYTWVKNATGVPLVYWVDQNVPQSRTYPYATLRFGDELPVGLPEQRESVDLGEAPGEEIGLTARQHLELPLSVQVWTQAAVGASSARALLRRARAALGLESVRAALSEAGVSVLDAGRVQNLSGLFGADRVGRANLDVRLLCADEAAERTGWIETVNGTLTVQGEPYPYTAGG